MKKLIIFALLFVTLQACKEEQPQNIPENAIKVSDKLYFVPVGADEEGCAMYNQFIPNGVSQTAIFYRRNDGTFTALKSEVQCN